ncbi:MAG: oligosaccharide flippase family protein, partial [Clostridiales bacterium]|nr:oligosaccharide flippase family protein [Clostridiales bacterium]
MKSVKVLFINVILLTAASLLMRTIAMAFQVYLSNKIGSEGIGLFQLILSVYFFAVTLATSGIRLAATRLVAEELGVGRLAEARRSVRVCLTYSGVCGGTVAALLFAFAGEICASWLGDARAALSLRMLAVSLPFVAASAVFGGYFTAARHAAKSAAVQVIEQLLRVAVTALCLAALTPAEQSPMNMEYACAAIVAGVCAGEFSSSALLFLLYRADARRLKKGGGGARRGLVPRMFRIALPVALSAYVTSGMRTAQHLLVPYGLKRSGASGENALAVYGVVHGMALPLLMFPSVLLDAVSELIVPELAECRARGAEKRLTYIVNRVFHLGMITSVGVMFLFLRFAGELGPAIYKNGEAARFILILAPMIPVTYLDAVVDGMLKGMGEQLRAMRYNIIDAAVSVALIYTLLPKYAVAGYIFTVFFGRALNFALSLRRLMKSAAFTPQPLCAAKAVLCVLGAIVLSRLCGGLPLPLGIPLAASVYVLLLKLTACVTEEDLRWCRDIFR